MVDANCTVRRRAIVATLASLASPILRAQNADWPNKPVKLVVASASGGVTDVFARVFAEQMSRTFKQAFVVENKAGANGILGNDALAKAPADGYTLLFSYAGAVVINPALAVKLPYNTLKDLQPVAQVGVGGNLLVVNAEFPAKNLREFVALMKANPDKYNYGSWGIGSGGHLAMEALKMQAGIKINHVPYKSVGQVLIDLVGGQISIGWVDSSTSLLHISSGKIRPLVSSGSKTGPSLPQVKTMTESGYKFDVDAWLGLFAPGGTPQPIVRRLNEEANRILELPDVRARFAALNMAEPPRKSVEQFAQTIRDDLHTWGVVVKAADIKPE